MLLVLVYTLNYLSIVMCKDRSSDESPQPTHSPGGALQKFTDFRQKIL